MEIVPVTERGFDVEIDGEGYFMVLRADGRAAFTRDGSFRLDIRDRVTTPAGFPLDPPITTSFPIERIREDGALFAVSPGSSESLIHGNMVLVRAKDPTTMRSLGGGLWEATGPMEQGVPSTDGFGEVVLKRQFGEARSPATIP